MLGNLMAFRFLDHRPLIDGELELVAPDPRWVDPLLQAVAHPLSATDPSASGTTRDRIMEFLGLAPGGRQPADNGSGRVPSYHFWMHLHPMPADHLAQRAGPNTPQWGTGAPPVEIAGTISLRIGNTADLELYAGHVGYGVYPPARGHHYAERACRLLLPIARAHGLRRLWITCNPDNYASRRTCERLGARFADVVAVPASHPLFQRGDKEKCRYWIDL
jgi:tagatose 1,6-diphosphate aldolase